MKLVYNYKWKKYFYKSCNLLVIKFKVLTLRINFGDNKEIDPFFAECGVILNWIKQYFRKFMTLRFRKCFKDLFEYPLKVVILSNRKLWI